MINRTIAIKRNETTGRDMVIKRNLSAEARLPAAAASKQTQKQEEIKSDSMEQAQEAKRLRIEANLAALR